MKLISIVLLLLISLSSAAFNRVVLQKGEGGFRNVCYEGQHVKLELSTGESLKGPMRIMDKNTLSIEEKAIDISTIDRFIYSSHIRKGAGIAVLAAGIVVFATGVNIQSNASTGLAPDFDGLIIATVGVPIMLSGIGILATKRRFNTESTFTISIE